MKSTKKPFSGKKHKVVFRATKAEMNLVRQFIQEQQRRIAAGEIPGYILRVFGAPAEFTAIHWKHLWNAYNRLMLEEGLLIEYPPRGGDTFIVTAPPQL